MKRIAGWLRQIADEIDPPVKAKRGRPKKACAHKHINPNTGFDGCSSMCEDCGAEMPDKAQCPQCDGRDTRLVAYDNSEAETGYVDRGWVHECGTCGERF